MSVIRPELIGRFTSKKMREYVDSKKETEEIATDKKKAEEGEELSVEEALDKAEKRGSDPCRWK